MFKQIKVFAILFALIGLGHDVRSQNSQFMEMGSADPESSDTTSVSTTDSNDDDDDDNDKSVLDGHLLINLLNNLEDSSLGGIFRSLDGLLRPLFVVLDFVLSPVIFLLRILLFPVVFVLNIILLPINGLSGLLGALRTLLAGVINLVQDLVEFLVSALSELTSSLLTNATGSDSSSISSRRKRRGIGSMIGMGRTVLNLPFRFVTDIIEVIYQPLRLIYHLLLWPLYHYYNTMTGSHLSIGNALSHDLSSIALLLPTFLLKLSRYSQGAITDVLLHGWAALKRYGLPAVDRFCVWGTSSSVVPADIQTMMSSVHMGYSMLKMMGVV